MISLPKSRSKDKNERIFRSVGQPFINWRVLFMCRESIGISWRAGCFPRTETIRITRSSLALNKAVQADDFQEIKCRCSPIEDSESIDCALALIYGLVDSQTIDQWMPCERSDWKGTDHQSRASRCAIMKAVQTISSAEEQSKENYSRSISVISADLHAWSTRERSIGLKCDS